LSSGRRPGSDSPGYSLSTTSTSPKRNLETRRLPGSWRPLRHAKDRCRSSTFSRSTKPAFDLRDAKYEILIASGILGAPYARTDESRIDGLLDCLRDVLARNKCECCYFGWAFFPCTQDFANRVAIASGFDKRAAGVNSNYRDPRFWGAHPPLCADFDSDGSDEMAFPRLELWAEQIRGRSLRFLLESRLGRPTSFRRSLRGGAIRTRSIADPPR
jgi:hypothetical protein